MLPNYLFDADVRFTLSQESFHISRQFVTNEVVLFYPLP